MNVYVFRARRPGSHNQWGLVLTRHNSLPRLGVQFSVRNDLDAVSYEIEVCRELARGLQKIVSELEREKLHSLKENPR